MHREVLDTGVTMVTSVTDTKGSLVNGISYREGEHVETGPATSHSSLRSCEARVCHTLIH